MFTKKCRNDIKHTQHTHIGGGKTSSLCATTHITRHSPNTELNNLLSLSVQGAVFKHLKLCASAKKSCLVAYLWFRPQILYSMAATIVRLERDSYRRSCFDLCPQERYKPSPISIIQFSKQTAGIKACIQLHFLYFYTAPLKSSQLQYYSHKQGRASYVTDLALRPVSSIMTSFTP